MFLTSRSARRARHLSRHDSLNGHVGLRERRRRRRRRHRWSGGGRPRGERRHGRVNVGEQDAQRVRARVDSDRAVMFVRGDGRACARQNCKRIVFVSVFLLLKLERLGNF